MWLTLRRDRSYPTVLQGPGRWKSDRLNEERIDEVLSRFELWSHKNGLSNQLHYSVSKEEATRAMYVYPLAGLGIGGLFSYGFVHPNSRYIGKIFTLFMGFVGYRASLETGRNYLYSRYFENYWVYPIEIRRMIDDMDARYAYKWLRDDYLDIKPVEKKIV